MASWKTIDDFYEHSHVPTVRLDEIDGHNGAFTTKTTVHYLIASMVSKVDEYIGLRHLFLLFLLIIYSLVIGGSFYYFESMGEAQEIPIRAKVMDDIIMNIAKRFKDKQKLNTSLSEEAANLKADYIELLNAEGSYKWSTYYKTEGPKHYKWTFGSSFFFAMNVYTTVGYGSIAPETVIAKIFLMFYALIFCPVTWIITRDLGQLGLVYLTTIYARIKLRFSDRTGKEEEIFMLPVWICFLITLVVILLSAIWVHFYDAISGPPESGLDWFKSLYFTVQTFTTIGLGDVMPNNIPFEPTISIVFFFTMPLLKIVNRITYLSLENGVHGSFTILGNYIVQYSNKFKESPQNYVESGRPTTGSRSKEMLPEETSPFNECGNQLTIHSIATFMQSNADVFGGQLGRVNLKTTDLETTTASSKNTNAFPN